MMAKENGKLGVQAPTWTFEDNIMRLHRCVLFLHTEGAVVDHELQEITDRIIRHDNRHVVNGDHMSKIETTP